MSTELSDLAVVRTCSECRGHGLTHGFNCPSCRGSGWTKQRVTTADLVAALIAEGGEIVEKRWPLSGIEIREPGRYLLYGPIPVESAEVDEGDER